MSSAAAHTLTPADLETRLTALGVPVARLIAAAHIARSTWSAWRAGRTRPRPDRWSAATEAFAALVAEADSARSKPATGAAAEVVPLVGSSPSTGAPPSFAPIATANSDAAVIAEAEHVAALARREWAASGLAVRLEDRLLAKGGARVEVSSRAAERLMGRLNRRLQPACRRLARQSATTPAAVAAKARAVLAIQQASKSDNWWVALRDSTVHDAARLDRTGEGERGSASLPDLTASVRGAGVEALASLSAAAPGAAVRATITAGSSAHVGAHLSFTPIIPAAPAAEASDAALIDLAGRLIALVPRQDGMLGRALKRRLARTRQRYLQTLADRMWNRLFRWSVALVGMEPSTPAGLTAKAAAAIAVATVAREVAWGQALTEAVNRDVMRLVAAPATTGSAIVPVDLAELAAEWVRSCSEDWRGDEALDGILDAKDDAGFERLKIQAGTHREVLWRIADLRSTSPDVLALKAAVVLADCRDLAELDTDIARRDGTSRGEGEIAVALSLVRDIIALHGDTVRHLVAAVATAAELPIAAEVAPDARAAA